MPLGRTHKAQGGVALLALCPTQLRSNGNEGDDWEEQDRSAHNQHHQREWVEGNTLRRAIDISKVDVCVGVGLPIFLSILVVLLDLLRTHTLDQVQVIRARRVLIWQRAEVGGEVAKTLENLVLRVLGDRRC